MIIKDMYCRHNGITYEITKVRSIDLQRIMKARNEQMDILRQDKLLSKDEQLKYYNTYAYPEMDKKQPKVLLFSYMCDGEFVGYGGMVHIDWRAKTAELSVLLDTDIMSKPRVRDRLTRVFILLITHYAATNTTIRTITTDTVSNREYIIKILEESEFVQYGRGSLTKNGEKIETIKHKLTLECYE